jgi:hypothetical protein
MNRSNIAGLLIAAAFAQGCATAPAPQAQPAPTGLAREETSIPFVSHQAIRDWEADGQEGIWVQDVRKKWYYGKLMAPCTGLDFATRVAFVTRGSTLDRFASVVVPDYEYQRCNLNSFTASDAPPPKKERKAKARKAPETSAEGAPPAP